MGESLQMSTAILTEHLRYHPISLVDDIINSINSLIYRAVSAVETGLLNTPPAHLGFAKKAAASKIKPQKDDKGNSIFPEAKLEIENGVHQLETLLEATVDKDFDKLELYVLRNVLHIPEDLASWVRLKHYENLDLNPSQDVPTPDEILRLHGSLRETEKLHTALLHESARNKALLAHLRAILAPQPTSFPDSPDESSLSLSFLPASATSSNGAALATPLSTAATFLTSQLPALRALLAALRPKVSFFSIPGTSTSNDFDMSNDQIDARKLYVEQQTRRYLVQSQGTEFTADDEIRDGGWTGSGRKIGPEEARALEDIVSNLGNGSSSKDGNK